ncbi:MAG: right-handed parallel beta-helix repeat-containing protein [Candidatus Omnitrophota bacterium]|jgi:hypothetical protein|nr:MAG: right-handed parallel beta-helix repeat-containing protein [Candidatus Omnitrophota bacterium]
MMLSMMGLTAQAQQNVSIKPGDDVVGIIQTVTDFDSVITFAAGHYKVTPKADATGRPDLMRLPSGTTIRGAGSGMDPSTATIIDCGFAFDSAIKIDDNVDGLIVENITLINTIDAALEFDTGSFDNTFNNVWALKTGDNTVDINGAAEATFNFCVFGWSSADAVNLADTSYAVFTNCDIFLGSSDIVQAAGSSEGVFRNCIFYAGPGSNDLESAGFITVVNCIGWDPLDGDAPGITATLMGRLDLNGGAVFMDANSLGEDPLYVAPPGMGFTAKTMDLHLQEGSPALTVGSTSFNELQEATGNPTFAGSQGLAQAPVQVFHWSVF